MVKAPFVTQETTVPMLSGQANGHKLYLVPLRFCKQHFIGETKPRIGNWYKIGNGQLIGWWNYFAGVFTWRSL